MKKNKSAQKPLDMVQNSKSEQDESVDTVRKKRKESEESKKMDSVMK